MDGTQINTPGSETSGRAMKLAAKSTWNTCVRATRWKKWCDLYPRPAKADHRFMNPVLLIGHQLKQYNLNRQMNSSELFLLWEYFWIPSHPILSMCCCRSDICWSFCHAHDGDLYTPHPRLYPRIATCNLIQDSSCNLQIDARCVLQLASLYNIILST